MSQEQPAVQTETRIITWNVNSLRVRADLVALLLDEERPDVLCLQELKLPEARVPRDLFRERGYALAIHGQPTWNGVLIASRLPMGQVERGLPAGDEGQARFVAASVAGLRLVNLYCPQGQHAESPKFAYKLKFYDALLDWLRREVQPGDPLLITGDLNIAPQARDLWDPEAWLGVPTFHPAEHARWRRMLEWGLADVAEPHLPPGTYSFWDYRRASFHLNRGLRIDHFLASAPVATRVGSARVLRSWRKKRGELKASDHAPVELVLR